MIRETYETTFPEGDHRRLILLGVVRPRAPHTREAYIRKWIRKGILPPEAESLIANPPCTPRGCDDESAAPATPKQPRIRRKNASETPPVHSGPKERAEKIDRSLPCVHVGEEVRVDHCRLCGSKHLPAPVHACAVHGECTLRDFKLPRVKVCMVCKDFETAQQKTPDDAGV